MASAPNEDDPYRQAQPGSSQDKGAGRERWRIEPMPAGLIDAPLDYLFAEHLRQREAAAILIMIADGWFDRDGVAGLIAFLKEDFARHVADEELVFFPALRAVCALDDEIDILTARLSEEHAQDESIGEEILELLGRRLAGRTLSVAENERIRHFAAHIRQHLALENGVLLPLARVRLTADDLVDLAGALKFRRARLAGTN